MAGESAKSAAAPDVPASLWCLFAAILIYGAAGSPTPDHPGMVEAVIGALLVAACLLGIAARHADGPFGEGHMNKGAFEKALQIFFISGLVVPSVSAAYFGNDRGLILRDIAAFAFMGLPLFLADSFAGNAKAQKMLCGTLVFAGVCFCLRTLLPVFNVWTPEGELLYLSNSPLAMFAGTLAALTVWASLRSLSLRGILTAIVCIFVAGLVVAAMLLDLQRATVGAIAMSLVILACIDTVRTPVKALVPFLICVALLALCYPLFADSAAALAKKTSQVGFNMRLQEASAVYDTVVASPVAFIAGRGWGSVFASPAVGGLDVNYTHSLISMVALKGGILLLIPGLAVVATGLARLAVMIRHDPVRGLSCLWPFAIPCFLYASYKSLDFGLILLMIAVWSNPRVRVAARGPLV